MSRFCGYFRDFRLFTALSSGLVDVIERVYVFSVFIDCEVQMLAGGTPRGAHVTDDLTLLNHVSFGYRGPFVHVSVQRLESAAVVNDDVITVSGVRVSTRGYNLTARNGINFGGGAAGGNVKTVVVSLSACKGVFAVTP